MTLTLKDRNLHFLQLKTLTDMVKTETDAGRAELMDILLAQFEDTGTKSFSVGIPGGEKVATFTIAEPKPGHKVYPDELLEWCKTNRPDLVETIEHPPVEAWTEHKLVDGIEKAITTDYKLARDTYITDEGEPVPGVEYIPAGTPKSFSVKYEKGGQERVIEAWRAGELGNIEPGKTLPQIGAGE